jgi:7 transmembrane receptor (rhodopsin family)
MPLGADIDEAVDASVGFEPLFMNNSDTLKLLIYAYYRSLARLNLTLVANESLQLPPRQRDPSHGYPEQVVLEDGLGICDHLFDLLDFLHVYYIPVIVFAGIFCNLLNVVVFTNTYLKHRSSSYYLAALALSDTCFLVSLGLIWVGDTLQVHTFNRQGWCQAVVYMSTASTFLSVWLTVAFTVERFIAVHYPLQRPHICTVARAKVYLLLSLPFWNN